MPEAPEARTVADKLLWLQNCVLVSWNRLDGTPGKQLQDLTQSQITRVWSYGKKVIISMSDDCHLVFELGMYGRFTYSQEPETRITLKVKDSTGVTKDVYWGYMCVNGAACHAFSTEKLKEWLSNYGPDILNNGVSSETWNSIWRNKKLAKWNLCKALLDQHVIAGVGNYLKSEILYYSGLHPGRTVDSLSDDELERLRLVTHHIIYVSYTYGGLTLESFISPDGSKGEYPAAVYGHINQRGNRDNYGNIIKRSQEFDARTTSYCPNIQK